MRSIGIVLIVIGVIWAVVASKMDTSVETEGRIIGSGSYSVQVPSMRVNNIGLMEDRRNHLLFAGLTILVGVMLFALSPATPVKTVARAQAHDDTRACPFCAEVIKYEAVKCKHCASELPTPPPRPLPGTRASLFGLCEKCRAEMPLKRTRCLNCGAGYNQKTGLRVLPLPDEWNSFADSGNCTKCGETIPLESKHCPKCKVAFYGRFGFYVFRRPMNSKEAVAAEKTPHVEIRADS